MTRIPLDGTERAPETKTTGRAPSAAAEPAPAADATATVAVAEEPISTASAVTPAPVSETMQEQIVCPRCNLHFEPRPQPARTTAGRKTILVVDDLAYFRQIAKDALHPTFEVKTAATSEEARELMGRGGVDLLVLDLTLDGCSAGRDLLVELQPKPCPILIFTAQDESEMYGDGWEDLRRLGADDLVIKGMHVAESLVRKASALLGAPVDDEEPIG
jgi:CheY-like chemotaxis protein